MKQNDMRVLILIAHANEEFSTSHRIAKLTEEALIESNHEVRVVDLKKIGFDKVASQSDFTHVSRPDHFDYETSHVATNDNLIDEIVEQQKNVVWCTHIIVIGPMWFYRYPAIFYAYFERVFCDSFAYTSTQFCSNAPLKGRKAMCVITLGGFPTTYMPSGPQTTVEGILYHVTRGNFSYCGFDCYRSQAFYQCMQDRAEIDDPMIAAKWKKAVQNLEKRPLIPFGNGVSNVAPGEMNEGQRICGLCDYTLDEAINSK